MRGLLLSEPVSRILSWAAIHLCGPPGPRRAGSTVLLGLAPGGVCRARRVTVAPVRSYRTLSPLPVRDSRVAAPSAVCSLLHFPAGFPGWVLPTAVPCGVRTFLEDSFRRSPRLPDSHPQGSPIPRFRGTASPSFRVVQRRVRRARSRRWRSHRAPALHDTPGNSPGLEPSGPPRRRGSDLQASPRTARTGASLLQP